MGDSGEGLLGKFVVVPGSSNWLLAYRVASELDAYLADVEFKKFPDGEKYVRIVSEVADKRVIIVQSSALKPDEYLVETFLLADALKDLGASYVILALAYFPYARQDERFKPGEAISLVTVTKLLKNSGVDVLITVDSHRHRVFDFNDLFGGPVMDVSAMPYLARYALSTGLIDEEVVVMGPDAEAEPWAKAAAESIGAREYASLTKRRITSSEVEITMSRPLDLKNREVLLVDDIISTGGTVIEALKLLKDMGAKDVVVACTHGLFVNNALTRILKVGVKEIFSSDTVPNPTTRVSVAPAIAQAVREL